MAISSPRMIPLMSDRLKRFFRTRSTQQEHKTPVGSSSSVHGGCTWWGALSNTTSSYSATWYSEQKGFSFVFVALTDRHQHQQQRHSSYSQFISNNNKTWSAPALHCQSSSALRPLSLPRMSSIPFKWTFQPTTLLLVVNHTSVA